MNSHSANETRQIAAQVAHTLRGGDVIGLVGPLGAGKTTFVQGLAKAFGIKKKITSPTFILLQSYTLPKPHNTITTLTHIDCYRLDDPQQLIDIGLRDHLNDPHTLTVIEWADKVKTIMPGTADWITFAHSRTTRSHTITLDKRLASIYAKARKKS